MELFTVIGAALMALLVMLLPALAHTQHWNVIREDWRYPLRLLFGVLESELGLIIVTYYVRGGNVAINGSTTAPTKGQANQVMKQSAVIQWGVQADTMAALFTHNWGLDNSSPTFYEPEVLITQLSDGTNAPSLVVDLSNTNVASFTKATGAPTTCVITLRRPHSMGQ